jgi:hypothetical protein
MERAMVESLLYDLHAHQKKEKRKMTSAQQKMLQVEPASWLAGMQLKDPWMDERKGREDASLDSRSGSDSDSRSDWMDGIEMARWEVNPSLMET